MLELNRVFVTVGTTLFPQLIDAVITDEILTKFVEYKCKHLVLQYGAGERISSDKINQIESDFHINVEAFDFKFGGIQSEISSSDLVISHAGAGSCIEVLTANKPLIVVVNEQLMDNHQTELAEQLHADGHLLYCTPKTLINALTELNEKIYELKPYENVDKNMSKFIDHLNSLMGFN